MLVIVQVLAVVFAAVAMALALAHALELPGKLRLTREHYLIVQPIYYPGFTIGGVAEPLALLLTLALLFLIPPGAPLWLTAGAFAALLAMHVTYWLLTHPINNFWLKDFELKGVGAGFFLLDPVRRGRACAKPDWTQLRDRWEYSHVARAALGLVGLILLVTAMALVQF